MKSKKIIVTFLTLLCVMAITLVGMASSDTKISDIPANDLAYDDIIKLIDSNIMSLSNGKFSPNSYVNRGQFATCLTKTLDLPIVLGQPTYIDIKEKSPYFPYVQATLKYISGFNTTKGFAFKVTERLKNEDLILAIIIAKNIEVKNININALSKYKDASDISVYMKPYYAAAEELGLIEALNLANENKLEPTKDTNKLRVARALSYLLPQDNENVNMGKFIWNNADNMSKQSLRTAHIKGWDNNGSIQLQWSPTSNDDFLCYHIQMYSSISYNNVNEYQFKYPNVNNMTTLYNSATSTWTFPDVKKDRYYKVRVISVYKDKTYFSNDFIVLVKDPISGMN